MSEKVQLKGGICEFDFGYNAKMEGYTTLMSDIPKLNKISPLKLRNFAYLADMRFSSVTQMPSALRISAVPLCAIPWARRIGIIFGALLK